MMCEFRGHSALIFSLLEHFYHRVRNSSLIKPLGAKDPGVQLSQLSLQPTFGIIMVLSVNSGEISSSIQPTVHISYE